MKHLLKKEENTAPVEAAAPAQDVSELEEQGMYYPAADGLKFWLMPFVCFVCFGLPTKYGGNITALCGFAPLCFFILCGFFNLTEDGNEQKMLKRRIKDCAILFLVMFVICLAVNVLYYLLTGMKVSTLFSALLSKRVLFNFFILCAWPFPMGESIWFIQSLLYAYIILYILNGLKLRRLRPVLLIVCALLMLLTGELAGLVRFRFFGYGYFPPNVFTRALPYLLLGWLLRKNMERLCQVKAWIYLLMVPVGLALAYGEFWLLSRLRLLITTSHAVGLGLAAFGICAWVIFFMTDTMPDYFCVKGRLFARIIYISSQLIAFLLIVPMSFFFPTGAYIVQFLGGLIVYPVCLLAAVLLDNAVFSISPV